MGQGVEADGGDGLVGAGSAPEAAVAQPADEHRGGGEDLGLGGRQKRLAGQQIWVRRVTWGQSARGREKIGAEVEQSLLAHLAVLADGADQAVAVAGAAADEMGSGGPDEHEDWGGRVVGAKTSQSGPSA